MSPEFDDLRPGGMRITAAARAFLARVGPLLSLALRGARPGEEITEFLRSNGQQRLAELIKSIDRHAPVHRDAGTFRTWARTVARFSFATYDLFLDIENVSSGHDADAPGPNRPLQADGDGP